MHTVLMRNVGIALREWDDTTSTLRNISRSHPAKFLAVIVDNMTLENACRRGIVQKLRGKDRTLPTDSESACGLSAGRKSIVLAWDRNRVGPIAPRWSDFWDVARHPGKRALKFGPRTTLEIALLADGVAPQDVYSVLSSRSGVDRAFHKLDQLRPYLVWWRTPQDARRILETGAALMLSAPQDAVIAKGNARSFSVQWRNALLQQLSWAIPANVPPDDAQRVLMALRQHAPLHDDTVMLSQSLRDADTLTISDTFWSTHLEPLQTRFSAWLTGKP